MLTPIQKEYAKNGLKFAYPNVTVYLSPDPVPAKADPPEAIGATTPEVIEEKKLSGGGAEAVILAEEVLYNDTCMMLKYYKNQIYECYPKILIPIERLKNSRVRARKIELYTDFK